MIPDHLIDTKALRKLADAATPGPWEVDRMGDLVSVPGRERDRYGGHIFIGTATGDASSAAEDAAFIAAARTAVPALLDALAAAEHRATRAEAQAAIRGRAVVIYRDRAREAEARIKAVQDLIDQADTAGDWTITCSRLQWAIDGTTPNPYRASETA